MTDEGATQKPAGKPPDTPFHQDVTKSKAEEAAKHAAALADTLETLSDDAGKLLSEVLQTLEALRKLRTQITELMEGNQ